MTAKTWRDWIVEAMGDLGGTAYLEQLYAHLQHIRPGPFTREWRATVRRTIETNSSSSDNWRPGQPDIFYVIGGKGTGHWGLRDTPR